MSRRNDLVYLGQMLDHARHGERIIAPLTESSFRTDETARYAVAFLVEAMGNIAGRAPETTRAAYPQLPWNDVVRIAGAAVADPLNVDLHVLWSAANELFAPMVAILGTITPPEPPPVVRVTALQQLAIDVPREEIAAFCRKWGIARLAFFGSVVREDFGPDSDVDVLVEFKRDRRPGWALVSELPHELSAILGGRTVDLMTLDSISRWMKPEIAASEVPVYIEEQVGEQSAGSP